MAEQYGAINISTANAIGAMLNKKMGVQTGFAPKDWPETSNLLVKLPTKTVSGSVASFSDGADTVPLSSCKATIAPNLEGKNSVTVTHTGKNLFDNTGFPRTVSDTNYYGQFQSGSSSSQWKIPEIHIVPDIEYTLSFDIVANEVPFNISAGIGRGNYLRDLSNVLNLSNGRVSVTFVLTSALKEQYGDILSFRAPRYGQSKTFSATISNIQLEYGSSASSYTPYVAPTTHTAQLGRTIYGGIADVVNGTAEPINILDPSTFVNGNLENISPQSTHNVVTQGFLPIKGNTAYIYSCTTATNGVYFRFFDSSQTEIPDSAINAYNATSKTFTTPSNAVYYRVMWYQSSTTIAPQDIIDRSVMIEKGNTATTYSPYFTPFTFDGQEVNSLYGVNNLWNNVGGNTEVTYRRDIDLALQESEA